MSEYEYELLLDTVNDAVGPGPQENEMSSAWYPARAPRAANDNQTVWPLIPFPAGWYAS